MVWCISMKIHRLIIDNRCHRTALIRTVIEESRHNALWPIPNVQANNIISFRGHRVATTIRCVRHPPEATRVLGDLKQSQTFLKQIRACLRSTLRKASGSPSGPNKILSFAIAFIIVTIIIANVDVKMPSNSACKNKYHNNIACRIRISIYSIKNK